MGESNVSSTQAEQAPVAEQQPGWKKAINLVAIIAIGVAGLFSLIFMSLVSYVPVIDGQKGDAQDLVALIKSFANLIKDGGAIESIIGSLMSLLVVIFIKIAAMIVALVCFIKMLIQFIRLWSHKENRAEHVSVSTVLIYISFAILVLVAATVQNVTTDNTFTGITYDSTTKAGLVIVGILFGLFACCKIALAVVNIIKNKSKDQIFNSAFSLCALILLMVVLILLAASGTGIKDELSTETYGYSYLIWSNLARIITTQGKSTEAIVSMVCALLCFVFQFVLIFNVGKIFHATLNNITDGKKKVDMNNIIGYLVVSVLYLIVSIVLDSQYFKSDLSGGAKMELTNAIMLVVMGVLLLAVAIVNKILVKDEAQPAAQPENV